MLTPQKSFPPFPGKDFSTLSTPLADYRIVREAGPDVMRLSVALTEAEASHPVLDTISSVHPTGYLISGTKSLATGTGTFVGSASVEAKMTDAELGTLLAAAVDRRGGQSRCQESPQNGMTSKNHFSTGPIRSPIACANGAPNTVVCHPRIKRRQRTGYRPLGERQESIGEILLDMMSRLPQDNSHH